MEDERRHVAGVDVDQVTARSSSAMNRRNELGDQLGAADDRVEPLDGAGDLEIARDPHAQADVDVAHLESGRQSVPGGVGDRDVDDLLRDRDEVVEVAADDLGRARAAAMSKPAYCGTRLGRIDP